MKILHRFADYLFILSLLSPALGQDHLQLDIGMAGMITGSSDLKYFTTSYNALNKYFLVHPLDGMPVIAGWRWGVGYRHFERFDYGLMVGEYQLGAEDQARFSNGERRDFRLDIKSAFVEFEAGYFTGTFLINGLVTFYINRQVRLETGYVSFDAVERPLDGVYRGEVDLSLDLGIAGGILKYPFLIMAKFSYPVYSGSNSGALSNGISEFPGDYFAFVGKGEYPGMSSDLDGLKIFFTLGYLFQF